MKHEYVVTKNQGDPYWHVDEDGKCIAVCFTKPIAVTIRSRLSEHDRLKAKAELFDTLVEWGETVDESSVGGILVELSLILQKFSDTAKDLK